MDFRYVNKSLLKMHVKYEDWKTAISYFARGAYMFYFDLKSGYHHVEIFDGHQTYLGFSWKHSISNLVKFYVFTVLPFGLSSAPHVFTKLLKPLERHWRYRGLCVAVFLDDGWGIEKVSQMCGVVANAVRADLSKAGFVKNEDKSVWIPCQRLDWLGFTWIVLVELLQLLIGGLSRPPIPLTVLLPLILFFLPEDWPLLPGR